MLRMTPLLVVLCKECIAGDRQPRKLENHHREQMCIHFSRLDSFKHHDEREHNYRNEMATTGSQFGR